MLALGVLCCFLCDGVLFWIVVPPLFFAGVWTVVLLRQPSLIISAARLFSIAAVAASIVLLLIALWSLVRMEIITSMVLLWAAIALVYVCDGALYEIESLIAPGLILLQQKGGKSVIFVHGF